MAEVKKSIEVVIGGKTLKLDDLPPFTMGDRIKLMEQGIDTTKLTGDPAKEAKFVLFALQKLDPALTYEEVLRVSYAKCIQVTIEYLTKGVELDSPFLTRSTNSAGTTVGQGTT